jgi:phosphoglycerol transferase MdoB-like AlkP superfamily enzyme
MDSSNGSSVQERLKHVFSGVLLGMIVCFVIMEAGRAAFIHAFTAESISRLHGMELWVFIKTSVLFDLKYAAQAFIPALAAGIFCVPFARAFSAYRKCFWILNLLGFLYILLFTVINHYFYLTYNRIIDVFFFAFLKEDPIATTKTMYEDYPLVSGTLAVTAVSALYLWAFPKIQRLVERHFPMPERLGRACVWSFVLVLLFALAVRGSLGTFPLRQNSAQISPDPQVNATVPNGPAALHWAREWAEEQMVIPDVSKKEIVDDYAALGIGASEDDLYAPLEQTTPKNAYLEENQPDVVVSIQESMSTHMFSYDREGRDLYGELRRHQKEDYWFWNFLSEGNGTMDSLTRILLEVPDLNLSTSTQADRDYVSNAFKPFRDKGYRVVFVTGCIGSWRNMDTFFRSIGVDEVYERSTLKKWFPDATEFAWGVDDEYMFRGALKILRERGDDKRPILLLTLSISNHPPFRVAAGVTPKTIDLSAEELKRFPYPNTTTLFATFRYANDQLGKFFTAVKEDPALKDRTILAATGDHNMRGIGYSSHPDELALGHAVPLIVHVPDALKAHEQISYDPKRWGSQKDLFATVSARALSGAKMHTFGCDLLGDPKDCRWPFAFNANAAVPYGTPYACNIDDGFAFKAIKLTGIGLLADPSATAEPDECEKAVAFSKLERDLYYYQAKNAPKLKSK